MRSPKTVLRPLRPADFDRALDLWKTSKGVGLRGDDTLSSFKAFLKRNPGISLGAVCGGRLVGTLLGGHDGRRGYLAHLAVADDFRGQGLGRQLVEACLKRLEKAGIPWTHAMVFASNKGGRAFWKSMGWRERKDVVLFSSPLPKERRSRKKDGSC